MISVHSSGQPSTKMIACDGSMNVTRRYVEGQHFSSLDCKDPREQCRTNELPAHGGGLRRHIHRLHGPLPSSVFAWNAKGRPGVTPAFAEARP